MGGAPTSTEYRVLVQHSPVMIWRAGPDAKCDYFNETWLAFTGRSIPQEMGDGWAEGVHPDDLERCVAYYLDHFQRREAFEMEYRLRRHDGVYRWIFDRGVPFTDDSGAFAGFIGSCADVDDRRRAHETQQQHTREQLVLARDFEKWIFDELEALARDRQITFDCDVDGAGAWDEHRLLQAISNLTSNAVQHGTPGSPVRVRLTGDEERVALEIHNRGTIPSDILPRIFEPFRSGRHYASRGQGLGLGLFIAKAIARAHGGGLEVKSANDQTTFRLVLPRHTQITAAPA